MVITKVLNSGVRIVMEQIPHVQSVAIGLWVKTGAVDEAEKYAGISHFVEHMMFKGTSSRTAREIAADIDKLGGQINAFTGKEATCYYVKSIYSNYKKAADVICDMLNNSLFEKKEMTKERKVIFEEIKMTQDTPDELAHETVTSTVFHGGSLGKSVIGTPTTLKRISRNVMVDYVNREYAKNSIVISVAGNFDVDDVCAYFETKLPDLADEKPVKEYIMGTYEPGYRTIVKDIEQAHLCMALPGLSLGDPDRYAFNILTNIMGGSMSSRFFQNIREQKGLAYSVYCMQGNFSREGYFNIYAGISHDKIKEAVGGIREELELLAQEGVTEEELESSREQLKAGFIFGQENVAGRMFRNGKNVLLLGTVATPEEVIDGFNRVTFDDIDRIKKRICSLEQYSAALATNRRFNLKKVMRG